MASDVKQDFRNKCSIRKNTVFLCIFSFKSNLSKSYGLHTWKLLLKFSTSLSKKHFIYGAHATYFLLLYLDYLLKNFFKHF